MADFKKTWVFPVVVGVVLVVLVGLFALGILDYDDAKKHVRYYYARIKGKVVATREQNLGAIQAATQCRRNLATLLSAKRKYAADKSLTYGATVTWNDILKELPGRRQSKCPAGGHYTINHIGMIPTCSIAGNRTSMKPDDHIIRE